MNETVDVDAYLQKLSPDRQAALRQLRAVVREAVPEAVETMEYRMPTYQSEGTPLCAFASQKHYMSLYMDTDIVEKHREDLAGLDIGKSCIRFRKLEKLPLDIVAIMLHETVQSRDSIGVSNG